MEQKITDISEKQGCGCGSDAEQLKLVTEMTKDYHSKGRSLIQVLYMAQGMYGSLPLEVQKIIAEEMGLSLSHVAGVVSFYSFFTTKPRGKHTIRVCLGTACYVRGGKKNVEKFEDLLGIEVGETTDDREFTLEVARCIGACGLAPAMMIDNDVYKQVHPGKIEGILNFYRKSEEGSDAV